MMDSAEHTPTPCFTGNGTQSLDFSSYVYNSAVVSRPRTGPRSLYSTGRPSTSRPRTAQSSIAGVEAQQIVCAVTESRGVAPTVGLAFVNLDLAESVLCQISDSQTYNRTVHKIHVFAPSVILFTSSAANPESNLLSVVREKLADLDCRIELIDRRYFAETTGLEYIDQLAFKDDTEAIKQAIGGNYFAVCCFAAALKYIDFCMGATFPRHTLRIKYEPSESSVMIDVTTIRSLELIQNLQNPKSRDCLFGLLNETATAMGSRLLRSNILQPSTDHNLLNQRLDAVQELASREETFFATREALKGLPDIDRVLTALIVLPKERGVSHVEQDINRVIALKELVERVPAIFEALTGVENGALVMIRATCDPNIVNSIQELIRNVINNDVKLAKSPVELRNQRAYAVHAGVNGLLDVSRVTYKEAMDDAYQHMKELNYGHNLELVLKFDNVRQFYLRVAASDVEHRPFPPEITNIIRKKQWIECSTLSLMKLNQKIYDAHLEVVLMSDAAVQALITDLHDHMADLFKICEGIALLDMLSSFAGIAAANEYVRPRLGEPHIAVKAGRHPIKERLKTQFISNDIYATPSTRFQVITGCNMSGKSTYIRAIPLLQIMAQVGCFVPATHASFPIVHQLFARMSTDDSIEANVSTFAAEMREAAFILRNIDRRSVAVIDELGRGTSTRDGLAIAIAIAEALVNSRAYVWFATHFGELARILAERSGVLNLHLAVDMSNFVQADRKASVGRGGARETAAAERTIRMQYTVTQSYARQTHYGLAIAHLVPLPPEVLNIATEVTQRLENTQHRKKKTSDAVFRERRRKLVLNLKELLIQARDGGLEGGVLTAWLTKLQEEFVRRMAGIEEERQVALRAECDDGESDSADGDNVDQDDAV